MGEVTLDGRSVVVLRVLLLLLSGGLGLVYLSPLKRFGKIVGVAVVLSTDVAVFGYDEIF
jgi:hypothetical protein